jgi:hypothetical protein
MDGTRATRTQGTIPRKGKRRRLMLPSTVAGVLAAPFVAHAAVTTTSESEHPNTVHPIRSCSTLGTVTWSDGSRVTSAVDVAANGVSPEFCNVTVLVPDRINIIVDLPVTNWNGRYEAFGGGGYNGVPYNEISAPAALAKGYVTSVTDTGHTGFLVDGEWAWSPTGLNYNLIQDFAYRGNHEMAVKSKSLTDLYYGTRPSYSYWNGCSSGGREGITEAMRYPSDFDGIYAGSPAINWTHFIPAEEWPPLVMSWLGDYLPICKEDAITNAVMTSCNGSADGARDGLMDPRKCHFDPKKLIGLKTPCGTITATDAAVVQKIWRGPRDSKGRFLWYGLEPGAPFWTDSPASPPGLGMTASMPSESSPTGAALTAIPFGAGDDWLRYFIHQNPAWNYRTERQTQYFADFKTSVKEWASDLATNNPNLSAFKAHGGKLVIWHGLADPVIFPQGTIRYYNRVLKTMGGWAKVSKFARLFLSPNVEHCGFGTGPALAPDDGMAAVIRWREQGIAPATVPGSGTNIAGKPITRNLCPYPQRMTYNGSGNVLRASSFHCASGPGAPA